MAETYTLEQIKRAFRSVPMNPSYKCYTDAWQEFEEHLRRQYVVVEDRFTGALPWSVKRGSARICYCGNEREAQRLADALNAYEAENGETET